ncbi:hypothetical protein N665_0269s0018 [Sinapis alba]|nr:hypothetical protein N665_0269s0018 [Sinapis alba]
MLSENNFSGSVPKSIAYIYRLLWLDLSKNKLSGGFPRFSQDSLLALLDRFNDPNIYANNSKICGMQIQVSCFMTQTEQPKEEDEEEKEATVSWEAVVIGNYVIEPRECQERETSYNNEDTRSGSKQEKEGKKNKKTDKKKNKKKDPKEKKKSKDEDEKKVHTEVEVKDINIAESKDEDGDEQKEKKKEKDVEKLNNTKKKGNDIGKLKMKLKKIDEKIGALMEKKADIVNQIKDAEGMGKGEQDGET